MNSIKSSSAPPPETGEMTSTEDVPIGLKQAVRLREYTLNDVGALKKKVVHEKRKVDIMIEKEAKDLSNVTILMRASFFEHVKSAFVPELTKHPEFVSFDNMEGVKAATESHGEAYVEYSVAITFKVNNHTHQIKITAYTTTSSIMIQPLG